MYMVPYEMFTLHAEVDVIGAPEMHYEVKAPPPPNLDIITRPEKFP